MTLEENDGRASCSNIGKHYELVSTYDIDGDLTIELYHKISEYSGEDLDEIVAYFDEVYPNHDELFANRILGYSKR